MNKILTYTLVGGASALAGGIVGYFLALKLLKNKLQEEYEKAVNEEIRRIRRRHSREESIDEEIETTRSIKIKKRKGSYEKAEPIDYSSFASSNVYNQIVETITNDPEEVAIVKKENPNMLEEEEESEVFEEDIIKPIEYGSFYGQPPQIISQQDYSLLPTIFEFVELRYFQGDDVLCDENGQPIDDVNGAVGDALLHFGEEAAILNVDGDEDRLYVVNGLYCIAYEIERYESSYEDWIR